MSVVGVTCCSSSLPLLDDLAMDVCVLDECSQIVEPLSLLPLVRAKCRSVQQAGSCQVLLVLQSVPAVPTWDCSLQIPCGGRRSMPAAAAHKFTEHAHRPG